MRKGLFITICALFSGAAAAQNPSTYVGEPEFGLGNAIGALALFGFLAFYVGGVWLLLLGPARHWAAANKGVTWLLIAVGLPISSVLLIVALA